MELDVAVVRVRMGKDALIPLNSKHISEISQSNRDTWKLTRGNRPDYPRIHLLSYVRMSRAFTDQCGEYLSYQSDLIISDRT